MTNNLIHQSLNSQNPKRTRITIPPIIKSKNSFNTFKSVMVELTVNASANDDAPKSPKELLKNERLKPKKTLLLHQRSNEQ